MLSHEPVYGLPWCLNIHGHDHNCVEAYRDGCKHLNLAANVCGYTPVNLGKLIKEGILSNIDSIHQMAIDKRNMPTNKDQSLDEYLADMRKLTEPSTVRRSKAESDDSTGIRHRESDNKLALLEENIKYMSHEEVQEALKFIGVLSEDGTPKEQICTGKFYRP